MITLPIWQILLAVFAAAFTGFLAGVVVMALMAAAGYTGDEQRSEPE